MATISCALLMGLLRAPATYSSLGLTGPWRVRRSNLVMGSVVYYGHACRAACKDTERFALRRWGLSGTGLG
ncbi:hypothetical protein B0H15DRAFT_860273 [Mycena belliarum]|uniref:Secreted protein n=1 Tax=Mycena belliarum TaxID=1033014 RepID=A0AAD6TV93_9AGAR|nr:hypothetical protein B0H15DRAFT_860273 [Mycena belliae]